MPRVLELINESGLGGGQTHVIDLSRGLAARGRWQPEIGAAGTFELFDMMAHGKADTAWMIMREVRLPRTALAMLVGMTLGMAGAALQGFLRNPLADPGVIGVSPAASLGAVLALYTGISTLIPLALPLMGILGALLCALLLQGLARRGGVLTLVLAGVAVSSRGASRMLCT